MLHKFMNVAGCPQLTSNTQPHTIQAVRIPGRIKSMLILSCNASSSNSNSIDCGANLSDIESYSGVSSLSLAYEAQIVSEF